MDRTLQTAWENLRSGDRAVENEAFTALLAATEVPVSWAYEIWDDLVELLGHRDPHQRARAAQLLCHLAKSDPEQRIREAFPALLAATRDERFVTARHSLQSLWKIGAVGAAQQQLVIEGLTKRFAECVTEKNYTLIRYDIMVGLKNLYLVVHDEDIRAWAQELIATEEDANYRKKYVSVWR